MPVYFYIMYILEVLALLQRRRVCVFEAACLNKSLLWEHARVQF